MVKDNMYSGTTEPAAFRNTGSAHNDMLGMGILEKRDRAQEVTGPESFPFFAFCLVLRGKGEYVDWETKKHYPLRAGDYFLRIPGIIHQIRIDIKSNWRECFLNFGCSAYPCFTSYAGISQDTPVGKFTPDEEWCRKFVELKHDLEHCPQSCLFEMLPRFFSLVAKIFRQTDESDKNIELMKKACAWLCSDFRSPRNIQTFCRENGWGYENFRKKFTEIVGMSPNHYRTSRRIAAARALLLRRNMTVADIAESLGYCSAHEFSAKFKLKTGMTPTEFRNSGEML